MRISNGECCTAVIPNWFTFGIESILLLLMMKVGRIESCYIDLDFDHWVDVCYYSGWKLLGRNI